MMSRLGPKTLPLPCPRLVRSQLGAGRRLRTGCPTRAASTPAGAGRAERVRGVKTRTIEFGTEEIEVSLLAQLVDPAQCRLIGDILLACTRGLCDGRRSLTGHH